MIAHTIQLALAPVFMLVAIGNIMNILSTRLGRTVLREIRIAAASLRIDRDLLELHRKL